MDINLQLWFINLHRENNHFICTANLIFSWGVAPLVNVNIFHWFQSCTPLSAGALFCPVIVKWQDTASPYFVNKVAYSAYVLFSGILPQNTTVVLPFCLEFVHSPLLHVKLHLNIITFVKHRKFPQTFAFLLTHSMLPLLK